jgi:hypothetical protein
MLPFNEAKDLGSPCSTRSAPVLAEEHAKRFEQQTAKSIAA